MSEGSTIAVDTAAVAKNGPGRPADGDQADLVAQLVEQARAAGLELTGDGGLLQQLTILLLRPPSRSAYSGSTWADEVFGKGRDRKATHSGRSGTNPVRRPAANGR